MTRVHIQQVRIRVRGRALEDVRHAIAELPSALSRSVTAIDAPSPQPQVAVGRTGVGDPARLADRIARPLAGAMRSALRGRT